MMMQHSGAPPPMSWNLSSTPQGSGPPTGMMIRDPPQYGKSERALFVGLVLEWDSHISIGRGEFPGIGIGQSHSWKEKKFPSLVPEWDGLPIKQWE